MDDMEGVPAMKAADVMVSNVITVSPEASVQDVADILLTNRISAVPVVASNGALIGIISEGDLIRRVETGTERRRSWWLELLTGSAPLAADYVKSHGRTVADVMTRAVITAKPDTPLRDIAALLEKKRIKRVPIVRNRKVVGIVSRANLVQALASRRQANEPGPAVNDTTIREEVMARLDAESWTRFTPVNVIVNDGNVDLWGVVDSETAKTAVRVAAEVTPGVRAVNDHLVVQPILFGA
jgi:CBS domain-containing protein